MNILVLNYEYPPLGGGGAAVTKPLCECLAREGHRVTVVTMGFGELPPREVVNGVTVERVKCWRTKQRVCHPWEQFSYCVRAWQHITRHLDPKSFDCIHCHFIIPTGLLALWLNRKYGLPYLLTAHGSDVIGHNKSRFALLYKLVSPGWKAIVNHAAAVTAPSRYLIDKIHETSPRLSVELVPNGIHTADYQPGIKEKIIITLTRLQESKGVQDLITACAGIDMKGWKVYLLGDGPYRSRLEELVRNYGLGDTIHFVGHVEGQTKLDYLSRAGGFFSGSRFEAFPVSVLEATLCGCNVIVSDIEPHRMLAGGEHIYSSQEELKAMLRELISTEPQVIRYSSGDFDWKSIYPQFVRLYERIVHGE